MTDPLRIDFRRDHDFTNGSDNCAWCTTPDGITHSIPPLRRGTRHGQLDGAGAMGNGAPVYRLIIALCDAGWEGYQFEAFDERILCLCGTVDRKSVPVGYGGEKKGDE